ncbi:non-specific lipid transfer protein GPI-anchored 2-like [Cynara cardunculus var. scolymus]|uniref:non-specific lipid transfer protein GPI-anchored 2-like n=1 Tax=Cynara cardunculus var. scolymus TaxID=59895 RepID=UPI000D62B9B1|nr:non-specific lipid transfer protein GPI-anchored 2-like [Cynara cardunculus var. scolymus]
MGSIGNLGLAFFLLTLFWNGSTAQSGCTNVLIRMAPCLNYVTGSSKTPSSSCCSSLANVVKSQPQCLCTALDGGTMAALGININKTTALALPGACKVKTPPVSRCDGSKQDEANGARLP